jgi:hypothetical protein
MYAPPKRDRLVEMTGLKQKPFDDGAGPGASGVQEYEREIPSVQGDPVRSERVRNQHRQVQSFGQSSD